MPRVEAKTRFPSYLLRTRSQQSPSWHLSAVQHVWHARHPGWG